MEVQAGDGTPACVEEGGGGGEKEGEEGMEVRLPVLVGKRGGGMERVGCRAVNWCCGGVRSEGMSAWWGEGEGACYRRGEKALNWKRSRGEF